MEAQQGKRYCHAGDAVRQSHHSDKLKSSLTSRLNRIEGQVRGVKRMIDEDVYCDDVLNVIASIQASLSGVGSLLLEYHMRSCVVEQLKENDAEIMNELMKTIRKLMK
ncbi:MAG: metal-sensitive transcriptional regulator [Bacteroidetes bacterium]|nr:metal-sensitive transcriptional regulator [Bacteroidota bacterium]